MEHYTINEIIKNQFNKQAKNFQDWSVTKNVEYMEAYFSFCAMTSSDRWSSTNATSSLNLTVDPPALRVDPQHPVCCARDGELPAIPRPARTPSP